MGAWFVDAFIEYVFRAFFHAIALVRSRKWPIVEAIVLSAECPGYTGVGCTVATVYYEYVIDGEKHGTWYGRPFIFSASGKRYATHYAKGAKFKARVKATDPTKAVPLWGSPVQPGVASIP